MICHFGKTTRLLTHRALPDVLAMEQVFLHPSLARCLSSLPTRSPHLHRKLWVDQKKSFMRASVLIKPTITPAQDKRLDTLGLKFEDLLKLYRESADREAFLTTMKEKGIGSKPLREKLTRHSVTPVRVFVSLIPNATLRKGLGTLQSTTCSLHQHSDENRWYSLIVVGVYRCFAKA